MRVRASSFGIGGSTLLTALAASLLACSCGESGTEDPSTVAPSGSSTTTSSAVSPSSTSTSATPTGATGGTSSTTTNFASTTTGTSTTTQTSTGASGSSSTGTTSAPGSSGGSTTSNLATSDTSTGGDTSSAPPAAVEWDNSGSTWSATIGATTFRVDEAGGRIIGYALNDTEVLVDEDLVSGGDNANNFGSTFWLSPQAQWNEGGWPPPTHIDSEDYEGEAAGEVLTLTGPEGTDSASEPTNDISIVKVFTPDAANNAITVDYQMKNGGSAAAEWAPWQITRVPSEGITFFPTGQAVAGLKAELTITSVGAYSFWQYDQADVDDANGETHGDKFIGDGAGGWLAHVHEGVLLLLQFTDTAPADFATDDGEIAIYASAADPYIEIEPQGGVTSVPANGQASWKVRWSLHTLPAEVAAEPGAALGDFAQGLATTLGPL